MTYGSGSLIAQAVSDRILLSSELVIDSQIFGVAKIDETNGFGAPFDGILGSAIIDCFVTTNEPIMSTSLNFRVGPKSLSAGTLRVDNNKVYDTIPTVTDNLFSLNLIDTKSIGVSFKAADSNATNGVITIGGVDNSRYTGDIVYATPGTCSYRK